MKKNIDSFGPSLLDSGDEDVTGILGPLTGRKWTSIIDFLFKNKFVHNLITCTSKNNESNLSLCKKDVNDYMKFA